MSKFTAAQLVELANGVYGGAELEHLTESGWTALGTKAETVDALLHSWRIKPAKKIIDLQPLIASGIDCEFSNFVDSDEEIGPLLWIDDGDDFKYEGRVLYFQKCRPRMNHKMFHDGGECPLPEGFRVVVYFRNAPNGEEVQSNSMDWSHKVNMRDGYSDIIGYEILWLADGWAYPWESDE